MVTSREWDWPRYRMAEVVQGESVAVSATIVATRKFQETCLVNREREKGF